MPRVAPAVLFALAAGGLSLAGCETDNPYEVESVEAKEGTGDLPDGALNRALNPDDAGVVGAGNVSDDADPDADEAAGSGGDAPAGDPLGAKPVSYEQFAGVLADLKGGPVLVDCWATWCGPCREAFPHTVKLGRQYADRGLTVVTLAFDPDAKADEVNEFLQDMNAGRLANYRCDDGGTTGDWDELDVPALPTYIVIDKDGEELARVTGTRPDDQKVLDEAVAAAVGAA